MKGETPRILQPFLVHVCWIIQKSRLPTNDITLMTMAWQHSADKLWTFSLGPWVFRFPVQQDRLCQGCIIHPCWTIILGRV